MNYYWISINNDAVSTVAFSPEGVPVSYKLIDLMVDRKHLPFSLELHNIIVASSIERGDISDNFYDYQPNSLAWPLMSEKMKTILESNLTGNERVNWKTVMIHGKTVSKIYYIPMFMDNLDTLDINETVFVPSSGIVLKPCFDSRKIKKYSMFHGHNRFWQISTQIYVNEEIKKSLLLAGINELCFNPIWIK